MRLKLRQTMFMNCFKVMKKMLLRFKGEIFIIRRRENKRILTNMLRGRRKKIKRIRGSEKMKNKSKNKKFPLKIHQTI